MIRPVTSALPHQWKSNTQTSKLCLKVRCLNQHLVMPCDLVERTVNQDWVLALTLILNTSNTLDKPFHASGSQFYL